MSQRPILILQMQRMGDLILSFPLLLWLHREYPGHPLWVVGEPRFYNALLSISPTAVYLPWTASETLRSEKFTLCVNLSHEPAASALAGAVQAEKIIGAAHSPGRGRYVHGNWQLYRTGLVHANLHNRFHWAELNALDCIPLERIRTTNWPAPREKLEDQRRIALFLGASEQTKRPTPAFWAVLAGELLRQDLRPILLGGQDDQDLAREVQRLLGQKILNLVGRLSLAQFAYFGQSVELMVTPDTGPMHLAAWTGLRTLNLSMGPVNPWETGPYQPGHSVLQAKLSCVGCWQCSRTGQHRYRCHEQFQPKRIARMICVLTANVGDKKLVSRGDNLNMFISARSEQGLYCLENVLGSDGRPKAKELVSRFWAVFWGQLFQLWSREQCLACWRDLVCAYPDLAKAFFKALTGFQRRLRQARDASFWSQGPPLLRPLFSHVHLTLQNADFSRSGERKVLKITEELLLIVAEGRQRDGQG
jgi:ADP-heptose:LPS heptosyltransferase